MNSDILIATASSSCPTCKLELPTGAGKCPHCHSRTPSATALHRGAPGRLVGGVCAGAAAYFGLDPVLVRVLFVLSLGLSAGVALWGYLLLWLVTPPSASGSAPMGRLMAWFERAFKSEPSASGPII